MTFPQDILYIHNTMWVQLFVCVCVRGLFVLKYLPQDINYLHESRIFCVPCMFACLHGSSGLLSSRLKHISVGNKHLIGSTKLANHQWWKPEPLGPPHRWDWSLVGWLGMCVHVVSLCVFRECGKKCHSPFHLRHPHGWRGGDAVSMGIRVKCH